MTELSNQFKERLNEIETYLDLLDALQRQVQEGPPSIGGSTITVQQQRILYSSVYLQLYNLVEASVTWCVDAVVAAASDSGRWRPGDLSEHLRREWVRAVARTHTPLNEENRLQSALALFDHLFQALPITTWEIEKGRSGNWDDKEIEHVADRLGFHLRVSGPVLMGVKRPIRDDQPVLALVRHLRNRLAHGDLSFAECGTGVTVSDLRTIKDLTCKYLEEVVSAFEAYITSYEFIAPARRPVVDPQT